MSGHKKWSEIKRKAQLTPPNALVEVLLPIAFYNGLTQRQRRMLIASLVSDFTDVGDLERLHSASYRNERTLQCSDTLACFYCQKIWGREEIQIDDWIDCTEDDEENIVDLPQESWTALCPWCGIDSVIGNASTPITPELVEEMNRYWFGF